ncbi:hypothetical protein EON80_08315, partial [bacterium]
MQRTDTGFVKPVSSLMYRPTSFFPHLFLLASLVALSPASKARADQPWLSVTPVEEPAAEPHTEPLEQGEETLPAQVPPAAEPTMDGDAQPVAPADTPAQGTQPPPGFGETGQTAAQTAPVPVPQPAADAPREKRRSPTEIRLRAMWTDLGVEAACQDAIIAYLDEDEKGKATVRAASRRLMTAVTRNYPPERMRELVALYKGAIEADKARRITAQTSLDAKIGFSLNPRLEGMLWLFGVLG